MLSIGLEDTLAYYNADDFVVGFKKMLAWQVRVIKQNEARQVAWCEHWYGGQARILRDSGVCSWLLEVGGVPDARHQSSRTQARQAGTSGS